MFRKLTASALLAATIFAAAPSIASAGRFDTHRERGHDREDYRPSRANDRRDDDRRTNGHIGIHIGGGTRGPLGPVCPPPPPVYEERVWVAPVCRTVTEQVWVAATYRTVVDRVWDWRCGRYEDHPRLVLVCPAHYETVTREEVNVPGHWEVRPTRVVVLPPPRDEFHFDLRIPIGR